MSVSGRKPGGRYSPEQRQEDRSEAQLRDRFAELGWPVDRVDRDLGEDLNVRVYDDGASTGLGFHVQLKSTADSSKLKLTRSDSLAYDLEVKDLLHWEVSTTLVVLVVWDVTTRTGWWTPVPTILDELDKSNEGWRNKGEVAVHVPLASSTDDAGLVHLRRVIADHTLPLVPRADRSYSLAFPNTELGVAGRQMFDRALDLGESVTFPEGFLPVIEFPSWHRRIYGSAGPGDLVEITMTPTAWRQAKPLRIEVVSTEGSSLAALSYVELRLVVPGRKRRVWNNEHQKPSVVLSVDTEANGLRLQFRHIGPGKNLYEAREAVGFLLACADPGSVIRVISLEDGNVVASGPTASATGSYDALAMRERLEVLDKLVFIQQRVPGCGSVSMKALEEVTPDDVDLIGTVFQILRDGKVESVKAISLEIEPAEEPLPEVDCEVRFDLKESTVELLGLNIQLGDVRATVVDSKLYMAALRAAQVRANASGTVIPVRFEDLQIVEEYLDWLPGHLPWAAMYEALDKLTKIAGHNEGYFARADGRAAGATEAVFDALVSERKIEQITSDVFHLNHFARSDHEQLVSLWLQTDRRGILSHDTALLLHEISDIAPKRRHITVPPGWDPGERKLDRKIVLHHAAVGEDEIRWLGPVPYTAPLRTLRDCIAAHLPPDLIAQAIANGLRLGMFTEADLPLDVHQGAA
ncbi:MAG: DUF4365 domain-containing protein [Byssovorax sp.]